MNEPRNEILEEDDFDTILSEDIDFSGSLSFEKPFLVRGRVTGEIKASSLLVIDEGAVVEADIVAPKVVICGSVKGNINASDNVEISLTGRLIGNIATSEIRMEAGCLFNGRCVMPDTKRP
ncbi:MAG: polymer-forming cytoskeletal protein [Treponema sp.]|nr:polymer-forming cytoskeletal protein [Treponema sp.]